MNTFPRRPTPFEYYMLADDRPAHPMTVPVRLRFAGRLDLARLRAAAVAVRPAHPLLAAHVRTPKAWTAAGASWVDAGPHEPPLWLAADGPDGPPSIDLATSVGWRGWVTPGAGGDTLTLLFHHACCDGHGAFRFLADLLAAYDGRRPAAGEDRLPAAPVVTVADRLRGVGVALRYAADYFLTRPQPLATRAAAGGGPRRIGDGWHSVTLSRGRTAALLDAAHAGGVTLNDVLLRGLYETLFAWNVGPGGRAVRVAVPVDLRDGPAATADNGIGMVFLDRRAADATSLLASVAAEMATVRDRGVARAFPRLLGVVGRVPGGMAALLRAGCAATAVLSNLGRVFEGGPTAGSDGRLRVGGAALASVELMPPVRPLTAAAFGALTYAGRLTLTLAADPSVLSASEGERLLRAFAGRVRAGGRRKVRPATSAVARPRR